MQILFVGQLWKGSTTLQRVTALRDLGNEVTGIDTSSGSECLKQSLTAKLLRRFGYSVDWVGINAQIQASVAKQSYDLIWIEKVLTIKPVTLQIIRRLVPNCRVVFFSPDDMMIPGNRSLQYLACIPLYDLNVTTKSYNVDELKALGAKEVMFIDNAYDPHTHRPLALTVEEYMKWQADVGFVGAFEQARYETMLQLAKSGILVSIRGPGWEPYVGQHPKLDIEPRWMFADDYTRAICATKVNLGFLRKVARDLQTTRSIEIPACGGFMLAERTDEHLRLFVEGQEAEFFASSNEMISKVQYYLTHDVERERIAQAGRERCVRAGYSNHDRLTALLKHLNELPQAMTSL